MASQWPPELAPLREQNLAAPGLHLPGIAPALGATLPASAAILAGSRPKKMTIEPKGKLLANDRNSSNRSAKGRGPHLRRIPPIRARRRTSAPPKIRECAGETPDFGRCGFDPATPEQYNREWFGGPLAPADSHWPKVPASDLPGGKAR
jgi:hypothetical protein